MTNLKTVTETASELGKQAKESIEELGRTAGRKLDEANDGPRQIVIDDDEAVLEVLAFTDAIGGDEQVEFAFGGKIFGAFLGAWREGRDDAGEILAEVRQRSFVVAGPGHER